jgi:hypothetical protein
MDSGRSRAIRWLLARDKLRRYLKIAAPIAYILLTLGFVVEVYVTRAIFEQPVLVGLLLALCILGIATALLGAYPRDEVRPAIPGPGLTKAEGQRIVRARQFLPEVALPGWTVPIAIRGGDGWAVDVGDVGLVISVHGKGGMWSLRVIVTPRSGTDVVGDARCAEVLSQLTNVKEFFEGAELPTVPTARVWYALPRSMERKLPLPEAPIEPIEPELSPHLVAARKYLPEKLPKDWSVPIAITEDHGTEWKDGAWMMGTGREIMLACLCTSKGRVKLAVTIFRPDGEEVSEGTALELLRQFRGVLEFIQTDTSDDPAPRRSTYLGELQPAKGERAMLN